jgi:hypothetical protein
VYKASSGPTQLLVQCVKFLKEWRTKIWDKSRRLTDSQSMCDLSNSRPGQGPRSLPHAWGEAETFSKLLVFVMRAELDIGQVDLCFALSAEWHHTTDIGLPSSFEDCRLAQGAHYVLCRFSDPVKSSSRSKYSKLKQERLTSLPD